MSVWHRRDIPDLAVVKAAEKLHGLRSGPFEPFFLIDILQEQYPGCPEKVIYAAIERAVDRGLIEYGVSMRTGWPTEKGSALLREP